MTNPNLEAAINRGLNEAMRLGFIASGSHAHFIAGFLRAHISPLVSEPCESAMDTSDAIEKLNAIYEIELDCTTPQQLMLSIQDQHEKIRGVLQALVDSSVARAVAGKDGEIERLRHVGGMMSNLCFNLKQSLDIPGRITKQMKELQEEWDAIPRTKEAPAAKKGEPS